MAKSKKKKIVAVVASCAAIAVIAASMTGMMFAGNGDGDTETVRYTMVETGTPTIGNIVVSGEFVGTVEAGQQVTIYPKAAGEVLRVNFQAGDTVEAGDVLFEIDSTAVRNQIAQTQATLANAQAKAELSIQMANRELENYNNYLEDGYNSAILQAESAVVQYENAVESASVQLRAARRAYNDAVYNNYGGEYYTDAQIDSLRNAKSSAEAALSGAQNNLQQALAALDATKQQVNDGVYSVEDQVKLAELNANMSDQYIALQSMQNTLADYSVKTPISGVVEMRGVEQYNMVSSQMAAFVISNKDDMTISFNVAESSLAYMRPGDTVTVDKNGETWPGTITEVSTIANAGGGLYTVKATLSNPPFMLYSGSSVKLHADTQKVENEMLIPIDAVYYENGSPYVYIFENNTALRRDIVTGISDAQNIQVVSGLSLTDQIITTWSANLYDGAEVYLPGTTPAPGTEADAEEAEVTTEDEAPADDEEDTQTTDETTVDETAADDPAADDEAKDDADDTTADTPAPAASNPNNSTADAPASSAASTPAPSGTNDTIDDVPDAAAHNADDSTDSTPVPAEEATATDQQEAAETSNFFHAVSTNNAETLSADAAGDEQ